MLSFRLMLALVVAGIALWGLFSLLDNLNEPGLLRSADRAVVKGCETLDSEETEQMCLPLFCQRALFNARSFSQKSVLRVTADMQRGTQRLIGVSATDAGAAPAEFVCVMQRDKVLLSRPARSDEIQKAASAEGDWLKLLSATMTP
jgi:hypothetical protein